MPNKEDPALVQYFKHEAASVKLLGQQIGFGRMMQLAQQEWRNSLIEKEYPPGGEFAYGPCVSATVVCGCREIQKIGCNWCQGSGWLTKRVKEAQKHFGIDN